MTNRTLRLLKHELIVWAKGMGIGAAFIFGSWTLNLIVNLIFSPGIENASFFGLFNVITFGFVSFVMGLSGIVAGSEVPGAVRQGISRMESFVSKMSAAVITSLLVGPSMILLNFILIILPGNAVMAYWSIAILGIHFLLYMAAFCVGFFIAILWQRIGWLPTLAIILVFIMLTGAFGIAITPYDISASILETISVDVVDVTLDNRDVFVQEVVDVAVEENTNIVFLELDGYNIGSVLASIGTILVFGTGSFLMTKKLPVKIH